MNTDTTPKILIVGAGPCGLTLALAARRNGIAVRIIEKSPIPAISQRGAGIQPRTQELLRALGVLDAVNKHAILTPRIQTYVLPEGVVPLKTFDVVPLLKPTASCPSLSLIALGQNQLEFILRAALRKYSCEVEFGSKLLSLTQDADGVDAIIVKQDGQEKIERYDFVVGTDGARGIVRKQLGLSLFGESRPSINLITGDVRVEGIDIDYWHMWGEMKTDCVFLRPTEVAGLFHLMMASSQGNYQELINDHDALQKEITNITGRGDIRIVQVVSVAQWTANIRMAEMFQAGRCFVAGDAAHVHSPTGGQGMNSGVQDSFNLAWKLALVQRGLAPMTLLDSYTHERVPVIKEMLDATTQLLDRTVQAKAAGTDLSHWDRSGPLSMLGVNYRWSSIVVDERDDPTAAKVATNGYGIQYTDLRAGDRAPDAPALKDIHTGETKHLFDVFDAARHTVLVFSASPERISTVTQVLSRLPEDTVRCVAIVPSDAADLQTEMVLEDTQGHAYSNYDSNGACDIAVVRPDFVLGALVSSSEALERYFGQIFVVDQ
ncbi:FAD binding domain-containing protein [Mycena maculata]|uniref:FAD binding domain-containing protein n=1 Tax=Mycena maculata TaxID=230809 RepID=A0AAD7KD07_9AGAR|nr:FAD binding domain-containing protein [Mycena maculata]